MSTGERVPGEVSFHEFLVQEARGRYLSPETRIPGVGQQNPLTVDEILRFRTFMYDTCSDSNVYVMFKHKTNDLRSLQYIFRHSVRDLLRYMNFKTEGGKKFLVPPDDLLLENMHSKPTRIIIQSARRCTYVVGSVILPLLDITLKIATLPFMSGGGGFENAVHEARTTLTITPYINGNYHDLFLFRRIFSENQTVLYLYCKYVMFLLEYMHQRDSEKFSQEKIAHYAEHVKENLLKEMASNMGMGNMRRRRNANQQERNAMRQAIAAPAPVPGAGAGAGAAQPLPVPPSASSTLPSYGESVGGKKRSRVRSSTKKKTSSTKKKRAVSAKKRTTASTVKKRTDKKKTSLKKVKKAPIQHGGMSFINDIVLSGKDLINGNQQVFTGIKNLGVDIFCETKAIKNLPKELDLGYSSDCKFTKTKSWNPKMFEGR